MVVDAHDREVIAACQRGDYDAFRTLFDTYKDRVYSIALRFSGDPAAAMDVAQETFLKVLSAIHGFRAESGFDAWLYRIVVNSCLDHRRRRRRLMPLIDDAIQAFAAPAESILHKLLRTEMRKNVQAVVSKLSPEQRIVVVLRYTEGLSYEAIAEILDCSAGTVASRLNRAHKMLERRLAHLRPSGGGNRG